MTIHYILGVKLNMFPIRSCDSRFVCLQMLKDNYTVDVIQVKVVSDDYFLK